MLSLKGTGVHKGIAVGKLVFYERQLFHVEKQTQEDTQHQVQRTGRQRAGGDAGADLHKLARGNFQRERRFFRRTIYCWRTRILTAMCWS